jgi:hypothetical protein
MAGPVIAYKLLREGRVAPFGGVTWPPPGEWLEAQEADACRSGLHGCLVEQLPLWIGLGESLWEIELEDPLVEERKVVARRGRLVRRVEAWDLAAQRAFVADCAAEAKRRAGEAPELRGYARDISVEEESPGIAAYVVARFAELHEGSSGYDEERSRQAAWLAARLGLEAPG